MQQHRRQTPDRGLGKRQLRPRSSRIAKPLDGTRQVTPPPVTSPPALPSDKIKFAGTHKPHPRICCHIGFSHRITA